MRRRLCVHRWVSNDGKGGKPCFAWAGPKPGPEVMRAVCRHCGHAEWFTENQWNGFMPAPAVESFVRTSDEARARRVAHAALKNYPPPSAGRRRHDPPRRSRP